MRSQAEPGNEQISLLTGSLALPGNLCLEALPRLFEMEAVPRLSAFPGRAGKRVYD